MSANVISESEKEIRAHVRYSSASFFSVDVFTIKRGGAAAYVTQDANHRLSFWTESAKPVYDNALKKWKCSNGTDCLTSRYPHLEDNPKGEVYLPHPHACCFEFDAVTWMIYDGYWQRQKREYENKTLLECRKKLSSWQGISKHWVGASTPQELELAFRHHYNTTKQQYDDMAELDAYKERHRDLAIAMGYDEPGEELPGMAKLVAEVRKLRKVSEGNHSDCIAWEELAMEFTGADGVNGARAELQAMRQDIQTHNEQDNQKASRIRSLEQAWNASEWRANANESSSNYWREQYNGAMQQVRSVESDNQSLTVRANVLASEAVEWRKSYEALANARAVVAAAQPTVVSVSIRRAVDAGIFPASNMSLTEILDYLKADVDLDSYSQRNAETLIRRIQWLSERNHGDHEQV